MGLGLYLHSSCDLFKTSIDIQKNMCAGGNTNCKCGEQGGIYIHTWGTNPSENTKIRLNNDDSLELIKIVAEILGFKIEIEFGDNGNPS